MTKENRERQYLYFVKTGHPGIADMEARYPELKELLNSKEEKPVKSKKEK